MNFHLVIYFIYLSQISIQAVEFKSDFESDEPKLEKRLNEDIIQYRKDIEERDGVDGPWMMRLFVEYRESKHVTDADLQRVWGIYENEKSHRIEDKLYAFGLIAELEDISKWEKGFDSLALSDDPKFIKTAIDTVMWKLDRGTEREKIIIANKVAILDRLVKYANDNKSDRTIHIDAVRINDLAKPYVGKTPSSEVMRPEGRPSNSPAKGTKTTGKKISASSGIETSTQWVAVHWGLVVAGVIGAFVVAMLIWRAKSKSKLS